MGRLLQLLEKVCFCLQAGIGLQDSQVRRHQVWRRSHCLPPALGPSLSMCHPFPVVQRGLCSRDL